MTSAVSQQLTPEERQRIIAQLDSTDYNKDLAALSDIGKYNITEAVPLIEEKIWQRENGSWDVYLDALLHFNSPNLREILHRMIDSSDVYGTRPFIDKNGLRTPPFWDPYHIRVRATGYLFKLGDYSTARFVLEAIHQPKGTFAFAWGLVMIKDVAKNVPAYADSAKTELIRIMRTSNSAGDRYSARRHLVEVFGPLVTAEIVYDAKNEQDAGNRRIALDYLFQLNYPDLRMLLIQRLSEEPFTSYKKDIAESLLVRYGTVEDYKIVQEYVLSESDATIKLLLGRALKEFKPPVPLRTIAVSVLLDSLISTKHQVFALGWLADKNFVNELDNHLENARKHLVRGDSTNTYHQVEKFQEKVQKEHEKIIEDKKKNKPRDKRFVTVEGWKFLFYNAQYILDRLPKKKGK